MTGASGFVGSHLVEELANSGYRVRALVRKTSNLRWLKDAAPELVWGDVTDPESLRAALEDVEYVFHAAGVVKARRRETYFSVNAGGTASLLEACRALRRPPRGIVIVSSLAAGGPSGRGPAVREDDPPRPISFYGQSKAEAERIAALHFGCLPIAIVRPPAIYGPRDTDVFEFIKPAVRHRLVLIAGRSDTPLSVIHVRDAVRGMILAATSEKARGRIYYLAGPEVITWESLARTLEGILGRKLRRLRLPMPVVAAGAVVAEVIAAVRGKPALFNRQKVREILADGWVCSAQRARQELGFRPIFDIRRGMEDTIDWYRRNGWL